MGTDETVNRNRLSSQSLSERERQASVDDLLLGADSEQDPTLSVVMPTLNEEEGVEECITRIRNAVAEVGITTEIIVSDSSTDRTPEIARDLGAIVVEPDQTGYGYAYRYAFDRVRGDYVVMGDADTTYDFEELPKLLDLIIEGDADIVMGSRLEGEIKDGAMPALHQYVGNPLLTKFLNVFYDAEVSDAHSGFRVFRADVIEELQLQTNGMEFASEMVMEAAVREFEIEEVPITYHEREGDATLHSFRDGWRHVKFMLLNAPSYLFTVPGALLLGAGVVLMGFAFVGTTLPSIRILPVWQHGVAFGVRSAIAGSLLAIVGYQVASMGVFATVASDPIRRPDDVVTNAIINHLSLERGGTVGFLLFLLGAGYAGYLIYQWVTIGYGALPGIPSDVIAFTLIVLGIQTIFGSFFMSSVGSR